MPPPPPSLGRKRQRAGTTATKHHIVSAENDEDANYIVYPSSDEENTGDVTNELKDDRHDDEDDEDGVETPRNRRQGSSSDFEMEESEVEYSEDQEPQRKRAKAGNDDGDSDDGYDDQDPGDDIGENGASSKGKGKRRVSQKWREDVYRPSPGIDSDDSDLNLNEITPEKRRGKKKVAIKPGNSINSRKPVGGSSGFLRNKSRSTPNLRSENQEANKIRKSRFYEGSMNDRFTRKGGVPPFRNHRPSEDDDGGFEGYNSFGVLPSSTSGAMPPPPRPLVKGSNLPQSTPPPPKSKFTFFAPISNWFSKRWQKATQEYEERERRKEQEVEVTKHVRTIMDRKTKAEKLYTENKLKGINQPAYVSQVNQTVEQEPLVTQEQVIHYMDPASEIGVAFTTDEVYAAPKMNESTMSVATIRPPAVLQGPTPRTSTETTGSVESSGGPTSAPGSGFYSYRDNDPRDCTPLTTDTTDPDVGGLRSRSRSPILTPSKPLTKAEQKKKERIEKKLEDLRRKLAETEVDLSVVLGTAPVSTSTPAVPASSNGTGKKVTVAEDTIVIHVDGNNEEAETEDEAAKIVESVMGEPEPTAVAARNRSLSPIKKIFPFTSKKTKEKDTANTALRNVNESAKIKKQSPASVRRRGGGRGSRGGKAAPRSKRTASEDPN
ncbi:hypothetical protein H072_6078 [Dactylellina haptotyla CBS 200.50]|uniref:Uncharacterized protein n=1 Tax=Dactylellina haptotyla (strain CBS 200.50) TaxID=1284197 RepID=S8BXP6_DACHA|nr:hypothetical protein H072_6078 [Dactylellina haptotyla CBS 200.50]